MPRYCIGCGYSLTRLEASACPECGRAFDPADERSFAARPRSPWPVRKGVCLLLAVYPWAVLGMVHLTWWAEWLGKGARPDPLLRAGSGAWTVAMGYRTTWLALLAGLVIVPIGVYASWYAVDRYDDRQTTWDLRPVWFWLTPIGTWALAGGLWLADPWSAWAWFWR